MGASDVKDTLDQAIDETGVVHIQVKHRPSLLSYNGPCYLSRELKTYLNEHQMTHARVRRIVP
jgi:putative transposase